MGVVPPGQRDVGHPRKLRQAARRITGVYNMSRSLAAALTLMLAASATLLPAASRGSDRTLPMRFDLRQEGPAQICGAKCRLWISASGAITADTPRDFQMFAQDHDLTGATVVLDSDGGSVHGAIGLGRKIRRLGLDTTVGRVSEANNSGPSARARLSPRADCESMCAFVLLAGIHRVVPPQARVMVHQIWLGDRREDPTAANYSAEDLVLVQRDIGQLAQYTIEMGGSIDLLDLALRIPPWEPMHALTQAEIGKTRVATEIGSPASSSPTVAISPSSPATEQLPRMTNGARATAISEQRWAVIDNKGVTALARRHPLTASGEDIGSFDLMVACGATSEAYDVSYIERRRVGHDTPLPEQLGTISVAAGGANASLKVVSSQRRRDPDELVTFASASVPASLIGVFAGAGNHSMMVTTKSDATHTAIRLGNTGAQQNLPRLVAACQKALGDRAALVTPRTGGLALAK